MKELTGYDKLAQFMIDERYAIFRQFKLSANRDLLYLQAELAHLEEEFFRLSETNKNAEGEQELYDRNWQILSTSKTCECGGEQWEKAQQIRTKLREYCLKTIMGFCPHLLICCRRLRSKVFRDIETSSSKDS